MFKRMLALATTAALLGLGPVAVQARTHHHHMMRHHMMTGSHSTMMHKKTQCRDAKTGRFIKCSSASGSM